MFFGPLFITYETRLSLRSRDAPRGVKRLYIFIGIALKANYGREGNGSIVMTLHTGEQLLVQLGKIIRVTLNQRAGDTSRFGPERNTAVPPHERLVNEDE
jgi:hypothetical protein